GWGGAVYIDIQYNPSTLTATNFQLTDLSFTNCIASGAGNNLHILSDDTTAIGNQIKTGFLLTVKDLFDPPHIISDLYTNDDYRFDYMGINRSILNDNPGTIDLDLHDPLFKQFFVTIVPNPSYIDGINGQDNKFCGIQSSMCKLFPAPEAMQFVNERSVNWKFVAVKVDGLYYISIQTAPPQP
ncbi:MAG: hypothetical protein EZS28_056094, partial [Streblomastix strix]